MWPILPYTHFTPAWTYGKHRMEDYELFTLYTLKEHRYGLSKLCLYSKQELKRDLKIYILYSQ